MDHLEAIVEVKDIFSSQLTEKIIQLIDYKAKENLTVRTGINKNVRNVKGYNFILKNPTDLFYWNQIKTEIEKTYIYYKAKFPMMASNRINQIDLLKYTSGCKYELHTDHYSTTARHLSIIVNLSDNYEGGDLIFTDQKRKEIKRIKLKKKSMVFFPSNFMYPHSIEPIKKGTRYSIVAWLQ